MAAETIFALSSGRPPAAIAVVRISGVNAHEAGKALAGSLPDPRRAETRRLRRENGAVLDDALVLRFDAPASATGEDVVELHCHGGRAVTDAVLARLGEMAGLREALPGEFTRRAFENGRIDLTEAEGLADLLEAETESQRRAALALFEGGLRKQVDGWREQMLALSAEAERAIDYAEEDDDSGTTELSGECGALASELREWLGRPRVEPLKDGVRVVIAGPPNAGKSSLLNAIAGQDRAIVTDVAGTTRDHLEVPLSLAGVPLLLTDTAGLRETADEVEAIGVARAGALVEAADILVWLGGPAEAPWHPRLIRVHPKADLGGSSDPQSTMPVSSKTGNGIAELLSAVEREARGLLPGEDAVALNRRQVALLSEAAAALQEGAAATDAAIVADALRRARSAIDRISGRAGVEDMLDALFSRFCLGK